jgi:hypothetical protein
MNNSFKEIEYDVMYMAVNPTLVFRERKKQIIHSRYHSTIFRSVCVFFNFIYRANFRYIFSYFFVKYLFYSENLK